MKKCRRCGIEQPESEYRTAGTWAYRICKSCVRKQVREHQRKPEIRKKYRARLIRNKYGLKNGEYENMVHQQQGKCKICQRSFEKRAAIDHNHKTGKVRGILCSLCNSYLGYIKDNPEIAVRMKEYLT